MSDLALKDVTVELGGRTVVAAVSLEARAGEWVGLVGPNGAGKTTLLRAVAGWVPVAGTITVDGTELAALSSRKRAALIASVTQRPHLPGGMPLLRYVLLGRNPHISYLGSESARDYAAVFEAMAALELDGMGSRTLGTLSGGEAQRAVIARALAQEAPILLLDEPTAALDLGHQQSVLGLVHNLHEERRLTVLSAMHDLTLAGQYCDRLVLLDGGRVVVEGSAELVLTEELILRHYGANVRVLVDDGPVVVPIRTTQFEAGQVS